MNKLKKILPLVAVVFAFVFWGCPGDLNDLNSLSSVDNIVGTWHAVMYADDTQSDYQVEITKSASADSVINISNFFNNNASAYAYVNDLEITLPRQDVGGEVISGTGTISSDFQTISWTVDTDQGQVTITMTPGTVTKFLMQ